MAPSCPLTHGGGFRGPPVPLILVPAVIHLVRSSCDSKMSEYLKELSKRGPVAIAENAHKIVQYTLSRVPSNILYWLMSKVLNLPPEIAMQTTEFLKSRTELDGPPEQSPRVSELTTGSTATVGSGDMERRLEKLELEYQMLRERQDDPLKLLTYRQESSDSLVRSSGKFESDRKQMLMAHQQRELLLPSSRPTQQTGMVQSDDSMQLVKRDPSSSTITSPSGAVDAQALLQDVGPRLGRIFLEWAGDTMRNTLIPAVAKSSTNQAFLGAGVDLAGRLVDAIVT